MFRAYQDRAEAGQDLSNALMSYKGKENTMVLALPRGGVPVAKEVADALSLPLDLWLVRKIGTPGHEELAMGALAINGICHLNKGIVRSMDIDVKGRLFRQMKKKALRELVYRNELYRNGRPPPVLKGKTVIIDDDGLATGATMLAAVESLRKEKAGKIIVAVPVGSEEACDLVQKEADEVICRHKPRLFFAVGQWFRDFSQTTDEEVVATLNQYHVPLDTVSDKGYAHL